MNEVYVRDRLRDALKGHGLSVRVVTDGIKCPKCSHVVVPQSGLPDMWVFDAAAILCEIEVKVVKSNKTAFSFSKITTEQREKLTAIVAEGDPAFIALGIITAGVPRDQLARIYLVHWTDWLATEAMITPHQNSIPLVAGKGMRIPVQENKLDIQHLLQGWELQKLRKGWGIPVEHPAYTTLNLNGEQ